MENKQNYSDDKSKAEWTATFKTNQKFKLSSRKTPSLNPF